MLQAAKRSLLLLVAFSTAAKLHAQYDYFKLHGGTLSVGATGPFTTQLTSNPVSGSYVVATPTGGVINTTVSNQQQFTTQSTGVLGSIQFHPKAWAGVEVNYGYTRYSERYAFTYSQRHPFPDSQCAHRPPTKPPEPTSSHPHHIPLQPFVNVGGGALFFLPSGSAYMTRSVGLVETGLDLPTHNPHLAFRLQGRALFYRAPNFYNSAISTRSWRTTTEPGFGVVYRF